LVGSRYRLLRRIGQGGFGAVFEARDERLDRVVAIKLLRTDRGPGAAERRNRLVREAKALANLQHPNVVVLFDAGEDEHGVFLVLEMVPGESLDRRLARAGPLPAREAAEIVREVARGLGDAHRLGIVHRDIKPANILLGSDGRTRVADFGVARVAGDNPLTSAGIILGTPSYMSPEQVEGGTIGPAADLFSLGSLLHECLTGHPPFEGGSFPEVLARITRGEPAPLPDDVRREAEPLARLIGRLLAKRPEERPASAEEVAREIEAWERGEAPIPREETGGASAPSGPRASRSRRKRVARFLLLLLPLLLVGGFVGIRSLRREGGPESRPGGAAGNRKGAPVRAPLARALVVDDLDRPTAERNLRFATLAGDPSATIRPSRIAGRFALEARSDHGGKVRSALGLADAFAGYSFADEPDLFRSRKGSSRRISFEVTDFEFDDFLAVVSAASDWPVVIDRSIEGRMTLSLSDVPWDEALLSLFDMFGCRATPYGKLWIVSTRSRADELLSRELPFVALYRPVDVAPARLVATLEPARSPRGIVLPIERLRAVLVCDRADASAEHRKVLAAVDPKGPLPELPDRGYSGDPIDIRLHRVDLRDFLRVLAGLTGRNILSDPDCAGMVTIQAQQVPWDNALDVILVANRLKRSLMGEVIRISPEAKTTATEVATIDLRYQNPELFRSLARYLGPDGKLEAEPGSKTVVVRGTAEEVAWFRKVAEIVDVPAK
jgi:serine/threonine-protein kinase